ncbi:MAG TPA: ankyrin repeat domain-containing protein, partial [Acidobacteriota bacterium]|nr:ankyrin repeat domain-containing protein [Acidobacteriota bacterium]
MFLKIATLLVICLCFLPVQAQKQGTKSPAGQKEIFQLVADRNLSGLETLIKRGTNVNAKNGQGQTALMLAA